MKYLGSILHPKDVTTKEYVDNADNTLKESIKANEESLENKVDKDSITNFTEEEIQTLWDSVMTSSSSD